MSTETATTDETQADPPPETQTANGVNGVHDVEEVTSAAPAAPSAPAQAVKRGPGRPPKNKDKDETEDGKVGTARSPEFQKLKLREDATIRDIIDAIGSPGEGAFAIRINRREPEFARDASGKQILTRGYLERVERGIDENYIKQKYGGGIYELTFTRKPGGQYITHKIVEIAGDPDLFNLPRGAQPATPASAASAPAPQEAPSVVTKAMDFMAEQVKAAAARADRAGGGSSDVVVEMLREELREARNANVAMLARLDEIQRQARQAPPPSTEDKIKDSILNKLIDDDSTRMQAQRERYESELRQLKQSHLDDIKRLEDRFDRDRTNANISHQRELDLQRVSHESAMSAAKSSFETQLAAAKASFESQVKLLEADNRRLERDNNELRDEVKELRAKKEKSIAEQVKEIEAIKDLVGGESGDQTIADKLADVLTNPDVITGVGKIFGKEGAPAGGAQGAQQGQGARAPRPPAKQVVRDEHGQSWIVENGKMRKAQKKVAPGAEHQLPQIDQQTMAQIVGYLERACEAGTDPETVAQSYRAHVPDPVLAAIREHGVDGFLSKVAKLPSSSPLLRDQAGRNWAKKLGKALVGD